MSFTKFIEERKSNWNNISENNQSSIFSKYYHKRIIKIYSNIVPQGRKILEIGSGSGDLLASLNPSLGYGIDFSNRQIDVAQNKYLDLHFININAESLEYSLIQEQFDYIILSDLVNDLWDVQDTLQKLSPFCHSRTRIIINYYSQLWQPVLSLAQITGLAKPNLKQNWLTREDLSNLVRLAGFEPVKNWSEILLPFPIPIIESFINKFLVKIWPFKLFAITNFMVSRILNTPSIKDYNVSVVVPAKNEAGNIRNILKRIPEMGSGTEIIFVEGNSSDETYETIRENIQEFSERKVLLLQQDGKGKGDAVRKGFSAASGQILMILDADLTVQPEDLPKFYNALVTNNGEFINGVRLVYPMEQEAMRFLNFIGNKFFGLAFSYLLEQNIKDTLCGTKVLLKSDYELISKNRNFFGDFDPFGDFDLLFGAARLGLKIIDLPVRYHDRTYGSTNINRWSHGGLLMKMVIFAARRLKFV